MLFVLSPAKSLDFESSRADVQTTQPQYVAQAAELVDILKQQSPQQIAELMSLSDSLSGLNVARYQAWRRRPAPDQVKPAVLAFNGDVYDGLQAGTLDTAALQWLQDHVCILSGLYGVLRPLDAMQAYRLEMGTALANAQGKNLYAFWGSRIAEYLNKRLKSDTSAVLVNLASQEYFKAVDRRVLKARVVECVFEDCKDGQYKIISFYAKRARGLMARFAAQHQLSRPEQLQAFDSDGYAFAAAASDADRLVFRRAQAN
mgnify:CR=1 FL=1